MFILGAGASKEYGYPISRELRTSILNPVFPEQANDLCKILIAMRRHTSPENISEFIREFKRSNLYSIDRFLSKRPGFMDLGKIFIAKAISSCENEDQLNIDYCPDSWYGYIWNLMTANCKSTDELIKNTVSFITFNYDRSLEQFLYNAISSTFGILNPNEVDQIVSKIKIIHMHGVIGLLPWQRMLQTKLAKESFRYGDGNWPIWISQAEMIKIPFEQRDLDINTITAKGLICDSTNICFMGFGYDPENLNYINPGTEFSGKKIIGTGYGLSVQERNLYGSSMRNQFGNRIGIVPEKIIDLLREHIVLTT